MIVITGGAGFIGSNLVAHLNEQGAENIIIVDQLGVEEKWQNINGLKFNEYYDKDEFIELIMEERVPFNIDAVVHLGACSSTVEKDSDYLMDNNYKYSQELVKYCMPRRTRFLYASSAATYGDGQNGYVDGEDNLESYRPLNMYGYSKHLFDSWIKKNKISDKVVGLKYFNVFGPNEYHKGEMRSVVHKAFEQINSEGKISLFKSYNDKYADGEQMRDFIYVKDAVRMTAYFLENRDECGLFNIGTGNANSWNALANAIFAAAGKPSNIEYVDMPEYLKEKYQYFTEADITRLRSAGYDKELFSLEDAVKDYVQNYLMKNKYLSL